MPDALMKTIPIWCAVFNRLLFPDDEEAGRLYTPPKSVSANEHAQIEQRIPGFVQELKKLQLNVPDIQTKIHKPLRPLWITRDSELPMEPPRFDDFHPILLCTASRRVVGAEISEGGYIQGAGDDAEGWSQGLTPPIFWRHRHELMSTNEDELPELIASYLKEEGAGVGETDVVTLKSAEWLSIATFASIDAMSIQNYSAIVTVGQKSALSKIDISPEKHLHLECRERKLGSRDLRTQLPRLRPFVQGLASPNNILICDATGKDLAPGVALPLLCLYADDNGHFKQQGAETSIDKSFIKQRLSWIMTSKPDASPSRTTLQSINDYLLTEHSKAPPTGIMEKLQISAKPTKKHPAEIIFHSLEGHWTLDRNIINHRTDGLAGRVTGTTTFIGRTPTSDIAQAEYLYREEGVFNTGPGIQMTVNRRWIWRLEKVNEGDKEPPSMSIHFVKADGETEDYLYNRLPVLREQTGSGSDGAMKCLLVDAEHPCGRDFYVSKYEFYLRDGKLEKWSVKHEVKGPAKDYVSTTLHERKSDVPASWAKV
jgi:tRNA A64-2'-O-ribosylphosphate transferase